MSPVRMASGPAAQTEEMCFPEGRGNLAAGNRLNAGGTTWQAGFDIRPFRKERSFTNVVSQLSGLKEEQTLLDF